jgi:hypothetical protein
VNKYLGFIKPSVVIGDNYLSRWYLIPRNRYFNIYLHRYTGSDDARALHDHPWLSMSILLAGQIHEVCRDKYGMKLENHRLRRFIPKYRSSTYAHRIVLESQTAWTIFFTGPRVRRWGFFCKQGWRDYEAFTTIDSNGVERGCD